MPYDPKKEVENAELKKAVIGWVRDYMKTNAFTDRKLTDLPTDDLQVTSRKYVNMNGATAVRPTSSVVGQYFFDTSLGKPVWWDGNTFVDATGTPA